MKTNAEARPRIFPCMILLSCALLMPGCADSAAQDSSTIAVQGVTYPKQLCDVSSEGVDLYSTEETTPLKKKGESKPGQILTVIEAMFPDRPTDVTMYLVRGFNYSGLSGIEEGTFYISSEGVQPLNVRLEDSDGTCISQTEQAEIQ